MNRIIILSIVGLFFVSSCGSKPDNIVTNSIDTICFEGAPDWVIAGGIDNSLSAVGGAKIGKAGISFARQEALANARDEISRILSVKVSNMFKTFNQTTGIGDDETVDKVSANVSKQVSSQVLRGSRQIGSWISKTCSELYILVGVDPTKIDSFQDDVQKATISSFRNNNALWQQFQAKNAQEELQKAIDDEFSKTNDRP